MTAALHSLSAHVALGCAVVTVLAAFLLPRPSRLDGLRILATIQFVLFTVTVLFLSPLFVLPVAEVVGNQSGAGLNSLQESGLYELHQYSAFVLWAYSGFLLYVILKRTADEGTGSKRLQFLAAAQAVLIGINGALGGSLVHG